MAVSGVGEVEDHGLHGAPSSSIGASNLALARFCPVFTSRRTQGYESDVKR